MRLADSDVLIDLLNNRGSAKLDDEIAVQQVLTTTVTRFEILAGALTNWGTSQALALFDRVPQLSLDAAAADRAADVNRQLRLQGIRLATADTLIAGIALANDLPLLTRNRRHFDRIPGLVVEEI